MGAVDPQLMGTPGHRPQRQKAAFSPLQHTVLRHRGLAVRADLPQQAGQALAGNGRIDHPVIPGQPAEGAGMVGLLQKAIAVQLIQKGMDMGIFSQQHNAEGIPAGLSTARMCSSSKRTVNGTSSAGY